MLNNAHQLILVGGLHRSGTTLFARCLAKHPEASGFQDTGAKEDEGQFLQSVYRPARDYGGPGRFGWHPASHLVESSDLVSAENRESMLRDWSKHWDLSKQLLIEKSPPNLLKSRFLAVMFPDAWQAVLLRHPLAACLATKKWVAGGTLLELLEHWIHCHELLWADAQGVDRIMILSYESFVAEPDRTMQAVDNVLHVEPHPAQLEVLAGINDKYFQVFTRQAKALLSRRSVRRMIDTFEPRTRALGYSLRDFERDEVASAWSTRAHTSLVAPAADAGNK